MSNRCSVCNSDRQGEIELALASGKSFRTIAAEFPGVGRMSLSRHKADHLSPALIEVAHNRSLAGAASLIDRLESLVERVEVLLANSEAAGNVGQALAAVRELRATLELLGKATGELTAAPTIAVNVLADPGWLLARGAILSALVAYPDARLAVADSLRRLEAPG